MSLAIAAQHLAKKGRHGDSMLVHMTPREVAGLSALARANGTELTVNPQTGLPEAFSLKSLLPMLAGAALAATGIGAPMAAMLVGGGTGLATGSLKKGLMAGLGAYGGAGLSGSVLGAGQSAMQTSATAAANPGTSIMAGSGTTGAAAPGIMGTGVGANTGAVTAPVNMSMPAATSLPPMGTAPAPAFGSMGGETMFSQPVPAQPFSVQPAAPTAPVTAGPAPVIDKSIYPTGDAFKAGLGAIKDNPTQFMTMDNAKYAMAAASPGMMEAPAQEEYDGGGPNPYEYSYDPGRTYAAPSATSSEALHYQPKYTRMADGGVASDGMNQSQRAYAYLMGQAPSSQGPVAPRSASGSPVQAGTPTSSGGAGSALAKALKGSPSPQYTYDPITQSYTDVTPAPAPRSVYATPAYSSEGSGYSPGNYNYGPTPDTHSDYSGGGGSLGDSDYGGGPAWANGGIARLAQGGVGHLGGYSDGGRLLRGPGDGVSDSIPAVIGDKRPARLADGEFVVPARIVSELGNGSTEAGARKLYAMMDRVQKARGKTTGKGKVAANSRAEKHLPA